MDDLLRDPAIVLGMTDVRDSVDESPREDDESQTETIQDIDNCSHVMQELMQLIFGIRDNTTFPVPKEEDERLVSSDDPHVCKICYEKRINTCISPCGHSVVCIGCSRELSIQKKSKCPICRVEIERIVKIITS